MKQELIKIKKLIDDIESLINGDKVYADLDIWSEAKEAYHNLVKESDSLPIVSASTVKSLHTALTNLLQATDDEGWNNEGEDWQEQLEARMVLAQIPKE